MPQHSPLQLLHAEYAQLHLDGLPTRSEDQRRSLTYYLSELALGPEHRPGAGRDDVTRWTRNTLTLQRFVDREKRMPRENNRLPPGSFSVEERTLVSKVRADRRLFATGRLCSYQRRRLMCIAGFSFRPLDDRFETNLEEYRRFTTAYRRAPSLRAGDRVEARLAGWAARQRLSYRAGTLPPHRCDALNGLGFWTWGAQK
jgi:hypothetical protein